MKNTKKHHKILLKTAGYLDTEDRNSINYIFAPPKKTTRNNIPADAGHFIQSERNSRDLKKSNLATKTTAKKIVDKYRKQARKRPYTVQSIVLQDPSNA